MLRVLLGAGVGWWGFAETALAHEAGPHWHLTSDFVLAMTPELSVSALISLVLAAVLVGLNRYGPAKSSRAGLRRERRASRG